ncbi:MAG: hypothetical protein IJZ79_01490 [Bacilli bacterium]|nr:hypothetical protein [Bacilli bacterium]
MIKARTRRIIQGADYSAQEPRVLSMLCADEGMLQAYRDGKDLYVEIAAISLHLSYKECIEHFPKGAPIKQGEDGKWYYAKLKDGSDDGKANFEDMDYSNINPDKYDYDKLSDGETDTYKDGKERRGQAKKILLGIMYGRGEASIAEQLGCEVEEAREIKNSVYDAFPGIKAFERESNMMVRELGFVTTLWGRKRQLPNYNLPSLQFFYLDENDQIDYTKPVHKDIAAEKAEKINSLYWAAKAKYIEDLRTISKIGVIDNNHKIADASRQIINSRVQGSAADMSKLALIKIHDDDELSKRGVKTIIPVHDEILIETPLRYARYVKARFAHDMETAAKPKLTIPVSCDVTSSDRWYGEELDLDAALVGLED